MAKVCLIGCSDDALKYADILYRLNALFCVYDEDSSNVTRFASRYNIQSSYCYTSIQDVIKDVSIDGIVITKDINMIEFIKEILDYIKKDNSRRKSMYILVNEPFTDDYNKYKEMAAIINSSKGKVALMPCYLEYFNPIIEEVNHAITSKGYEPILFTLEGIAYSKEESAIKTVMHDYIIILTYLIKELPSYVSSVSLSKGDNELVASLLAYSRSKLIAEITVRVAKDKKEESSNYAKVIEGLQYKRLKVVYTDGTVLDVNLAQELKMNYSDNVREGYVDKLYLLISNFIAAIDGRDKLKATINDALLVERIKNAITLSTRLGSPIYITADR